MKIFPQIYIKMILKYKNQMPIKIKMKTKKRKRIFGTHS